MSYILELFNQIFRTYMEMAPYLLLGLTFAGILHVLFKKEFIVRHLGSDSFGSVIKAAILGVPLPLCSCGVIPTALSLRKSRASKGAVMSFLVSTPQTGVDSIVATYGMLGPVFAVFRPVAAFLTGIAGGFAVRLTRSREAPQHQGDADAFECVVCNGTGRHSHSWVEKIRCMARYGYGTFLDDISVQLVVGIVISGLISYFLPDDFFVNYVKNDFTGMLLMIVAGVPLYVCATASIPIAAALMMKGLSPGVAFVFLVVGPATNAASVTLIIHSLGRRFVIVYLSVMIIGAMLAGYALNFVYMLPGIPAVHSTMSHQHHTAPSLSNNPYAVLFSIILAFSLLRKAFPAFSFRRLFTRKNTAPDNVPGCTVVGIQGMTCSHCAAHVAEAIRGVKGVERVSIDPGEKCATLTGACSLEEVRDAVQKAGYRMIPPE